jgi:hypothetical protein
VEKEERQVKALIGELRDQKAKKLASLKPGQRDMDEAMARADKAKKVYDEKIADVHRVEANKKLLEEDLKVCSITPPPSMYCCLFITAFTFHTKNIVLMHLSPPLFFPFSLLFYNMKSIVSSDGKSSESPSVTSLPANSMKHCSARGSADALSSIIRSRHFTLPYRRTTEVCLFVFVYYKAYLILII